MKNRIVGVIIVIFAALMGFMVWLFNNALTQIVNDSCSHGPTCPMWGNINFHTNLSIGIIVAVVLLGLYFIIFSKDTEAPRIIRTKDFDKKEFDGVTEKLDQDEKHVFEKLLEKEGAMFQSELVDEDKYTKVKVTRILDKLEGRGLIERRRRGMTNVVILKHK
jgi:uncharacterized membrane protein